MCRLKHYEVKNQAEEETNNALERVVVHKNSEEEAIQVIDYDSEDCVCKTSKEGVGLLKEKILGVLGEMKH